MEHDDVESERSHIPTLSPSPSLLFPNTFSQEEDVFEQLDAFKKSRPHLTYPRPIISSEENFADALIFLNLQKPLLNILRGLAFVYPMIDNINNYQKDLIHRLILLTHLQDTVFYQPEKADFLQQEIYEIHQRQAVCYILLMGVNPGEINKYVDLFKKQKRQISSSSPYYKELQEFVEFTLTTNPHLVPFFDNSNSKSKKHPPPHQRYLSKKLQSKRKTNIQQKIVSLNEAKFSNESFKGCFDGYFYFKVEKLFVDKNVLLSKQSSSQYQKALEHLCVEFLDLETVSRQKAGKLFNNINLGLPEATQENLLNFYGWLRQLCTMPGRNPRIILEHILPLLVQTGRFQEALLRTEVLREIISQKEALPKSFVYFRASVLALNGQLEEWQKLLKEKEDRKRKKELTQREKRVVLIKRSMKLNASPASEHAYNDQHKSPLKDQPEDKLHLAPLSDDGFERPSLVPVNYKATFTVPREKSKTRKQTTLVIDSESSSNKEDYSTSKKKSVTSKPPEQKTYYLSNNAYKTYRKIRESIWKISRKDLFNLFAQLGCEVNTSKGKGSHSRIFLQRRITITHNGNLVAVLPEFLENESALEQTSLTIPNWDSKWDSHVPPYLPKQIVAALEYLGATEGNVFKKGKGK